MARKQDKLRPYRVDYFNIDEMKDNDMALVRSVAVRAVTSAEAATKVLDDNSTLPIVLIRSYRFYKKITNNGTSYKAVEDLFNEKNALIVMEEVEKYRANLVPAVPDVPVVPDHATPDPAFGVERATFYKTNSGTQVQAVAAPAPTSGPDSPATVAVVDDLQGMLSHDAHEQAMDNFVPDSVPEGKSFPANADMQTEVTPFGEKCPECEDGFNSPMPGTPSINPFVVTGDEPLSLQLKVLAFAVVTLVVLGGLIYFLRH